MTEAKLIERLRDLEYTNKQLTKRLDDLEMEDPSKLVAKLEQICSLLYSRANSNSAEITSLITAVDQIQTKLNL